MGDTENIVSTSRQSGKTAATILSMAKDKRFMVRNYEIIVIFASSNKGPLGNIRFGLILHLQYDTQHF